MSQIFVGANPLVDGTVSGVNDGTFNRLAVSTSPTGGVQPECPPYASAPAASTVWMPLANGANTNMLVNGTAASPVVFQWPTTTPGHSFIISTAKVVVTASNLVLNGASITATSTLLGIGATVKALPNGILFRVTSGGTTVQAAKVQITEDFFAFNGCQQILPADTGKTLIATMSLYQPILANSTDCFSVLIQDMLGNLSNFQLMRVYVGGTMTS